MSLKVHISKAQQVTWFITAFAGEAIYAPSIWQTVGKSTRDSSRYVHHRSRSCHASGEHLRKQQGNKDTRETIGARD